MSDMSLWPSVAPPSSEDPTTRDPLMNHASHHTVVDPTNRDFVDPTTRDSVELAISTSHQALDKSGTTKPFVIIPVPASIRESLQELRVPPSTVVFNVYRCWVHRRKGPYDRVYSIARLDVATGMERVEYIVTWPRRRLRGASPGDPYFQVHRASLDGPLVARALEASSWPQIWFGDDTDAVEELGPHYVDGKLAEWTPGTAINRHYHHCDYLVEPDQHETVYAKLCFLNADKKRAGKEGKKIAVWEFYGTVMDLDRLVTDYEVTRFDRSISREPVPFTRYQPPYASTIALAALTSTNWM